MRLMLCKRCGGECERMNNRQLYCAPCSAINRAECDAAWRLKNADRVKTRGSKWVAKNREKVNANSRAWAAANRGKVQKTKLDWQARNPEKARAACRRMYHANIDEWRERKKLEMREKMKDPMFALSIGISTAIRASLDGKKGRRRWQTLVGYTLAELKSHLEKQFVKGMAWANRGDWHIDHIVPQSAFRFATAEDPDFKAC